MEINRYAPIIIPTLNRYEHFKRCIESLEKCKGAECTDVYVGLDYPPSEKYIQGWKKIDSFLEIKKEKHGFKNLIVFKRDHNCGVCNQNSNASLLLHEVKKSNSCYIFTEDDNEFSPCFLDFMNKALVKYENDTRVYSVCGYNQEAFYVEDKKVVFVYDNSAWGLGRWTNREIPDINYVKKAIKSPLKLLKLWRIYPALLYVTFEMLKKDSVYGDALYTIKCICENQYQIRPSMSMVRNYGDDGSGQHSSNSQKFCEQRISDSFEFEWDFDTVKRDEELDHALYHNMLPDGLFDRIKLHLSIFKNLLFFIFQ